MMGRRERRDVWGVQNFDLKFSGLFYALNSSVEDVQVDRGFLMILCVNRLFFVRGRKPKFLTKMCCF